MVLGVAADLEQKLVDLSVVVLAGIFELFEEVARMLPYCFLFILRQYQLL